MMKRLFTLTMLLVLAFGLLPGQKASAQSAPVVVTPGFGYTWQDIDPHQWIELKDNGGIPVVFGDGGNLYPDDAVTASPIPIGFTFPYFENQYTQLYISTNGFISFNQPNTPYYVNQRIPMDNLPNAIIAPLWSDLKLEDRVDDDSAVYYKNFSNQYLVIEFYNVFSFSHDTSDETLTFEIILYPNGDIDFVYADLNDVDLNTLTIGFEDAGGVDGYQWLYNVSALPVNQSVRAVYPSDGKRVKAYPRTLSGLTIFGETVLPFTVHNTGTLAAAYSLTADCPEGDAGWGVAFEDANGSPITATATLTPGADYPMQVRLSAPDGAQPGSYTRCTLTIASPAGGGTFEVEAQAAVAAPFAQTFVDSGDGYVQFVTSSQSLTRKIFKTFTGAYLSLLHMSDMDYLLAWEKSELLPQEFININMSQFRATSSAPIIAIPLQNHAVDPLTVKDSFPVMASTPGGQMGVAFLRYEKTAVVGQNLNNVFFGLLNSRGLLIADPLNLTEKPAGAVERYRNISMTVDPLNNRFVLAWEKVTPNEGGDDPFVDIEIAIVGSNGGLVYGPTAITQSQVSLNEYTLPRLTHLSSGKLAAAYTIQLENGDIRIGYALLNPNGSLFGGLQELSGYDSKDIGSLTAAPLADGNWLIAWVNDRDDQLLYVPLDGTGNPAAAVTLVPFGLRAPADIASTTDGVGNVIMTWNDAESDYLYYTLISPAGDTLTPPMPFRRGQDPLDPNIFSSGTGTSLSTCPDVLTWTIDLPLIRR